MAKIFKSGTSLAIALPMALVRALKLKAGEELSIQLSDKGRIELVRLKEI